VSEESETLSGVYKFKICDTYICVYMCIWTYVNVVLCSFSTNSQASSSIGTWVSFLLQNTIDYQPCKPVYNLYMFHKKSIINISPLQHTRSYDMNYNLLYMHAEG